MRARGGTNAHRLFSPPSCERASSRRLRSRLSQPPPLPTPTARAWLTSSRPFGSSASRELNQVSGSLDTRDGRVESRAYVRKKFFPEAFLSRVDMGLSYATTQDDVKYGIATKKSFELTDDGLTTLDVKGGVTMGSKDARASFDGCVELTQKIFNFQEDQDLKLRIGWDARRRRLYGQIRENNWTFNTDFKERWDVRYDL